MRHNNVGVLALSIKALCVSLSCVYACCGREKESMLFILFIFHVSAVCGLREERCFIDNRWGSSGLVFLTTTWTHNREENNTTWFISVYVHVDIYISVHTDTHGKNVVTQHTNVFAHWASEGTPTHKSCSRTTK